MTAKLRTLFFFCTAALLFAALGWVVVTRRALADDISQLKLELESINKSTRLDQMQRDQFSADQEVLSKVFQQCRSADDVPPLSGHRIVSNQNNDESASIYLPDGGHQLTVRCVWNTIGLEKDSDETQAGSASTNEPLKGERSWSFPLPAKHGYRFQVVDSSHQEEVLGWELSCNAEDFPTRTETLPLPPLRTQGGAWSSYRRSSFPNQVDLQFFFSQKVGAFTPSPLRLAAWTKYARSGNINLKVEFELTLISDNPLVVSASDAEVLQITGRTHFLGDYLGGGRYGVKTP